MWRQRAGCVCHPYHAQVELLKRREEAKRALMEKLALPYTEQIPEMAPDDMFRRVMHTRNALPKSYHAPS